MNNEPVAWTACLDCGKRVTGDSIHTCSPQLKTLTDKEIKDIWCEVYNFKGYDCLTELDYKFCREMIRKAQEK
jgi:hypothetical protein